MFNLKIRGRLDSHAGGVGKTSMMCTYSTGSFPPDSAINLCAVIIIKIPFVFLFSYSSIVAYWHCSDDNWKARFTVDGKQYEMNFWDTGASKHNVSQNRGHDWHNF